MMHLGAQAGQPAGPLRGISWLDMRQPVATLVTDKTHGVTLGWFFADYPTWGQVLSHDGEVDNVREETGGLTNLRTQPSSRA
jgi:hypothetical protein